MQEIEIEFFGKINFEKVNTFCDKILVDKISSTAL